MQETTRPPRTHAFDPELNPIPQNYDLVLERVDNEVINREYFGNKTAMRVRRASRKALPALSDVMEIIKPLPNDTVVSPGGGCLRYAESSISILGKFRHRKDRSKAGLSKSLGVIYERSVKKNSDPNRNRSLSLGPVWIQNCPLGFSGDFKRPRSPSEIPLHPKSPGSPWLPVKSAASPPDWMRIPPVRRRDQFKAKSKDDIKAID